MGRYIIRRIVVAMPSLAIVTVLIAGLLRLQPGDVVMARLSESGYLTQEDVDEMRAELGLDKSFPEQYVDWVTGVFQGDLGVSLWTGRDVLETLATRSRVSIQLAIMSMVVAICTAIPLGIVSAVKQDSWMDYVARLFSITGLSVPDFFLATMLLYVLSVWVGWLPDFGYTPPWEDPWANMQAFVFPALIVGYRLSAITARMTRSAMLEVLRQDYVRTARAKGLVERIVIFKHALRNALIPVITIIGSQLTFLLGGLVIIEVVFSLPGVGTLGFEAIQVRDYPVVQGVVFFTAILFITSNLLVDLSYAIIDPRIRYS
ncbi:MAG: ABC transporter permease [Chloroflexota bacterium]|nr:ABC transporter permease [Chloroflexota bacterium]MDE2697108.1 ABC transporter permease [Chloroflexota bacterium]MXW24530.1 ABC transporter permease [Chloroflexota bacterium]MXZ45944.1 ABC transporter permease [Chloroflexota bacterium]MXZ63292.1 ABC transporter permease [Chloroflexota bacterium]